MLRENGFSPLGIPRLRGAVYTIAVIDRRGDDGRLVIDARDGRIIRFMPAADAYGMAPAYEEPSVAPYRPQSALPPPTMVRGGPPRPPAPIPHVASRTVPLPKAAPQRAETPVAAAKPAEPTAQQAQAPQAQPTQQTAAVQPKPAEAAAPDRRSGQAAGNDPADAGDAGGAGAGLGRCALTRQHEIDKQKAPENLGRLLHYSDCCLSSADTPPPPGSNSRRPSDATPARGGRHRARSWWRSCAWRGSVRNRD